MLNFNEFQKFAIIDGQFICNPTGNENIFFQVNESSVSGKAKNSDIVKIRAIYIDFDMKLTNFTSLDEYGEYLYKLFQNESILPSYMVNSGGGFHMYFEVASAEGKEIERAKLIQKRIVKMFRFAGADQQASDIARIMRMPESFNTKYEHRPKCKIVGKGDRRYSLSEMEKFSLTTVESMVNSEVTVIKNEKIKIRNPNQEHPYFYQLLNILGSRHYALFQYALYLKQNYFEKNDIYTILLSLIDTIQNKERRITEQEVENIVKWVFSQEHTVHYYRWTEHQRNELEKSLIKAKELFSNDSYYAKCLDKIWSHIIKYGVTFYMSMRFFKNDDEFSFSEFVMKKITDTLINNEILTVIAKPKAIKVANHYCLNGFEVAATVLIRIVEHFNYLYEKWLNFWRTTDTYLNWMINGRKLYNENLRLQYET